MKRAFYGFMVAMVCGACGSSSVATTGSGSSSGTVGGLSLSIADAAFYKSSNGQGLSLIFSSTAGLCAAAQNANSASGGNNNPSQAATSYSQLALSVVDPNGVAAHAYTGSSVPSAYFASETVSGTNYNIVTAYATNSNLTFTSVTDTKVQGNFALSFTGNQNGTLSGTFTAGNCNALASY